MVGGEGGGEGGNGGGSITHGSRDGVKHQGCDKGKGGDGFGCGVNNVRKGNLAQFGFHDGESFIGNTETAAKVFLKRKGGSCVLDVEFVGSGF